MKSSIIKLTIFLVLHKNKKHFSLNSNHQLNNCLNYHYSIYFVTGQFLNNNNNNNNYSIFFFNYSRNDQLQNGNNNTTTLYHFNYTT